MWIAPQQLLLSYSSSLWQNLVSKTVDDLQDNFLGGSGENRRGVHRLQEKYVEVHCYDIRESTEAQIAERRKGTVVSIFQLTDPH